MSTTTITKAAEPAPVEERSPVVEATVTEFVGWVTELAVVAGILTDQSDTVAPALTFDEACHLLDVCRGAIRNVESATGGMSRRIADLWDEGKAAVLDVEGVLVEIAVHHRKDRRHWDHDGLMREVVGRHLEKAAADGRVPDPYEVGAWLLEAALPSYWRLHVLADLGIDSEPFCRVRDEIPEVELRRPVVKDES